MNYLQLLYYFVDYGWSVYRQLRFVKVFLKPLVDEHCAALNYPLSAKEQKKVGYYYPLFNHIVNCENYLCIRGRRLTLAEQQRLAILSAMATLYDDLIDEERWEEAQYFAIVARTLPEALQTPKVRLIYALDDRLRAIWQPTDKYLRALKKAIEWQVISARQLHASISLPEILDISQKKCGYSSLLWASILDVEWLPEEEAFIFQSGYVGQLVNDLFDTYKDREDGVYTFVRKVDSMAMAKRLLEQACVQLHQMILDCGADAAKQKRTIRRMACIHAFGMVALQHLSVAEKKYGLPMPWESATRAELVTDMAFWRHKCSLYHQACEVAKLR